MRREFFIVAVSTFIILTSLSLIHSMFFWVLLVLLPIYALGFQDYLQRKHAIRRNFPIIGRLRYLLEMIRPEINQYFIESNSDGAPFSREQRSVVYQRSKLELDTLPFGTKKDVYAIGYEWVNHSIMTENVDPASLRIKIGGSESRQPYSASLLNISAMSYGALSPNAILALNGGAKDGNFAHNTGEGGLSPYHLQHGGDLIWQIGTGYFSCRNSDGHFDAAMFSDKAQHPNVKMIELKVSQGAKPGHGGILPARKVTPEIAKIRNVPMGFDVVSPPRHSAFNTPVELLEFVARLRDLSGGKPVGVKLCVGKRREFFALCKAMLKTGILPDYISIDGGEGGTGAAPLEFSNYVGTPGVEALIFVHNALVGIGLREKIRIFSSGKVTTAFEMIKRIAIGADVIYSARGMLLSLGCIQALRCNANTCPTGIATQDRHLIAGLDIPDKRQRVKNFHHETLRTFSEMLGAMGLVSSGDLRPWHVLRRVESNITKHYAEIYDYLDNGALLKADLPPAYERAYKAAVAESFRHIEHVRAVS